MFLITLAFLSGLYTTTLRSQTLQHAETKIKKVQNNNLLAMQTSADPYIKIITGAE
jgi:hypothetical protein